MSYRLFVRPLPLSEHPEPQRYNWLLQDAAGDAQAHGEADTQEQVEQTLARNALDKVELVGLIPADETVFCTADIPAKQRRFVAQALPYAVEEQVAQDIETLHVALGAHTGEGYQVAAIDKGLMARWQRLFSGWHHAPLAAVYPDAALLPVTRDGWTLCLAGSAVLLLGERGGWLAVQAENLPMFAYTLSEPSSNAVAAEIPVRIYGSAHDLDSHQRMIDEFARTSERLKVTKETLDMSVTELLAWSYHQRLCDPINLCQGAFSLKASGKSPLTPWKPLIAVATVWFVMQVALEIGMGLYHQKQAERLQAQAMTLYRDAFPDDKRTHAGNVKRVIQGQLRVAESDAPTTDFVTLLQFTGNQYSRLQNPEAILFNSINYSRNRGELVVDVRADSYDRMSRLRNGLIDAGLQADIGSVVNESGGARGRLTVSGGE